MASNHSNTEPRHGRPAARLKQPHRSQPALNNWVGVQSKSRPAKKDNPEREREATLSRDSTPVSSRGILHTPHTYPRTKPSTQLKRLDNLRQGLSFDETSTENGDPLEMISMQSEDSQSQDSGVQDATPDSNQIVGRLMQIRDYLKQAMTIKESLEKDSPSSQEQFGRIDKLCCHLKEQEEGYLALLQKMLADRSSGTEVLNNQRDLRNAYSLVNETRNGDVEGDEDSDVSLGMDAGSEVSECTTSNVDVYIADEVDGSFRSQPNVSRSRSHSNHTTQSCPTTPRLKQTNVSLHCISNQPFDELVGVELVEEVMSASSDGFDVSMQANSDEVGARSDKESEVRALKKQRDLLKKMLDQQRMLKSLHERQAELLELQRKTEAEAVTGVAAAQRRVGGSDSNDNRRNSEPVIDEDKDRDEKENEESEEESDSELTEVSDANGYDEPPPTEEETEVPAELQALRNRLHYLKNVFDENLGHQMDDQEKLQTLRQMQTAALGGERLPLAAAAEESESAEESECSNPERKQLRQRLDELQDKKGQMERLLNELQMLRQYRSSGGQAAADDTTASESTVTGHAIREQQEKTQVADVTAGQAETVLDVMEQESKLRKLEEVRGRLDQLKGLVQYYQADRTDLGGRDDLEEVSSMVDSEVTDSQDLSLAGNLEPGKQLTGATDFLDDASDLDSNISLGDFGNDPEIQEKVRKLESARQRLSQLQSLVNMVQQWPETAEVLPEDLAELAATAMEDTASEISVTSKTSTASGAQRFSALYDVSLRQPASRAAVSQAIGSQTGDHHSHNILSSRKLLSEQQRVDKSTSTTRTNQQLSPSARTNQQLSPSVRTNQQLSQSTQTKQEPNLSVAKASLKQVSSAEPNPQYGTSIKSKPKVQRREDDSQSAAESVTSLAESEVFYLQRMEEQKSELQNLMNERNKLLSIQNELKSLHEQYMQTAPKDLSTLLKNKEDASLGTEKVKASKSAVTFSKAPVDITERANDELYSRMMEQRMERQASRKAKGEEDQLTADVTTLATWGESETSSSDDESDDENTPDDEGEIDEDDDGYPSDGILQVEEEEEAHQESDRDTYTVEDEYQFRQRYPVDMAHKSGRQRRPHTHKLVEPGNPAAGDYWKPLSTVSGATAVGEGVRGGHGSGTDMISKMKDQLDATTDMCQHLLQEQRKLSLQMQGDYKPPNGDSWLENRVMYSINQLYSKVMDMQAALQVTVDQVYAITQHLEGREALESAVSAGSAEGGKKPNTVVRPSQVGGIHSLASRGAAFNSGGPQFSYGPSSVSSSTVEPSDGERTPIQLHPTQGSVGSVRSEATSEADRKSNRARQLFEHNYSIPPLDLDQLIKRRQEQSRSLNSAGQTYPSPSLSAIAAGRVRVPLETMYKPGISSGICGTAYAPSASSAVSSVREDQSGNNTPIATPNKETTAESALAKNLSSLQSRVSHDSGSDLSLFEALRETIYSEVATLISQNENRPHFLIELFRELQMLSSDYLRQRGLYSIQELVTKFLTEDVSSQQIKLDTDTESDILASQPAWMLYHGTGSEQTPSESCVTTDEDDVRQMLNTKHKLTPVNSAANLGAAGFAAAKLERVGSIKSDFADYIEQVETQSTHSTAQSLTGSALDDPFNQDSLGDTVIHLEKVSNKGTGSALPTLSETSLVSMSLRCGSETSVSDVSLDMPFARSPLGDTAIDLQEAMQKVKDIDRRREAKREARKDASRREVSETGSSSSAQCSENEGSADVQMTRIDTQKLDRQIKRIMTEIIPVLREHMDNVCSSQLLHYLQQKVIELTALTGDQGKPERAVEFTQFFQKQLLNILRDSLAKFEGRRMRDCGEEILVDISEILFNELAFFKLMQDLDDPEVKDRIALNKWRAASGEPPIAHMDTDTEGASTADESIRVISEQEEEVTTEGESEETSGEEEDLGKERDDAFAEEVNTSEQREPGVTDIHFELAPSETKPMTRIGSDEDCSGEDEDTSEISTDDGDDTAISRLTAQDATDQPDLVTLSVAQAEPSEELKIDDLPPKLDVDTEAMAARAAAETELLSTPSSEVLPDCGSELAGSVDKLKEPMSADSCEDKPQDKSGKETEDGTDSATEPDHSGGNDEGEQLPSPNQVVAKDTEV
ncbi:pericentriolar material 1 protein-like [Watersipora subatra]|uniref:pericentriolar material 1 protein-like n=1 Tax=Watersipora subatra TaxID=2589382 RepID=UPI00355AF3ED